MRMLADQVVEKVAELVSDSAVKVFQSVSNQISEKATAGKMKITGKGEVDPDVDVVVDVSLKW